MSTKRKQLVSGYVPSLDNEEGATPVPTAPTAKKPRVAPAASSGLTAPAFNQPKAASTQTASIPPHSILLTPAAAKSTQQLGQKGLMAEVPRTALLTPRATPNPPTRSSGIAETRPNPRPTHLELSLDNSDTAMPPASPVESCGKEKTCAPEPTPLPRPSQPTSRRPYAFQLDALSNEIAERMRKDEYKDKIWDLLHLGPQPSPLQRLDWTGILSKSWSAMSSARKHSKLDPDSVLNEHLHKLLYSCLDHVEQAIEVKAPHFDGSLGSQLALLVLA